MDGTRGTVPVAQVREVLARLHDLPYLQTHPLARSLPAPAAPGRSAGALLHRAVVDALASLRPPEPGAAPERARTYHLLELAYLEGLPAREVCRALGLSKSVYYRELARGVAALAAVLAARWDAGEAPAAAAVAGAGGSPRRWPGGPLTSFVGRERELAEIARLLGTTRLLTLTGAGGCGKTRLALHAAERLAGQYPDGVRLVELAALTDPALVPAAVAAAAGVRETAGRPLTETLQHVLRDERLLLLLDNCEHLLDACAQLTEAVLRSCPDVRVLATSREPMRVAGEVSWRVPPLPVPPAGSQVTGRAGQPSQYASVQLFADRAAAVQPGFAVTGQNYPAVAEICRRLDGLPLALELAAARVRVLPPERIAARLGDRFQLLTGGSRTAPPHQQTLRASIAWSHELLSEAEQVLFRRLAAFAGGWTLEAAEAVCAGEELAPDALLDLVTGLVDKSLVVAEASGGEERYRLPETIRQYALERLQAAGEAEEARGRHADYYLALAADAGPDAAGFDRLEREHGNLRAALGWLTARCETDRALRLGAALWGFWAIRGHLAEGRAQLAALLALPGGEPTADRRSVLEGAGRLALNQGDHAAARAYVEQGLRMARALSDARETAGMLRALGNLARERGDHQAARSAFREALALSREHADARDAAESLSYLGLLETQEGDYARARAHLEESLDAFRELGNGFGVALAATRLGYVAHAQGEHAEARALFAESLAFQRAFGDRRFTANLLTNLAMVATDQGGHVVARAHLAEGAALLGVLGDRAGMAMWLEAAAGLAAGEARPARAVRLAAAAAALRAAAGVPAPKAVGQWLASRLGPAERALGEGAAARARAEGRATPERAVAEAWAD